MVAHNRHISKICMYPADRQLDRWGRMRFITRWIIDELISQRGMCTRHGMAGAGHAQRHESKPGRAWGRLSLYRHAWYFEPALSSAI